MLPSVPSPPAAQAAALLQAWETRTAPAPGPAYAASRARVLACLTELCDFLRPLAALMLDGEDLRTVLAQGQSLRIATAHASGPDRAPAAARQLLAHPAGHCLGAAPAGPAVAALLGLSSHPATPLLMDELTLLTETVLHALGPEAELVFGHDETGDTAAGLQLWLLVSYAPPGFTRPLRPCWFRNPNTAGIEVVPRIPRSGSWYH